MPTIKLTYFPVAGRAEPVRVAFSIGGVPFTDERLPFPEVMARREQGSFPLAALPVMEVDGVVMTQTAAMLRYAAAVGARELYPSDPFKAFVVDSVIDTLNDTLSHALAPSFRERDPEKKLAMRAELAAGTMSLVLKHLESLASRFEGPFLTGATMTIADLMLANQMLQIRSGHLDGLTAELLAPYPRLNQITDAYLADARVQAWMNR